MSERPVPDFVSLYTTQKFSFCEIFEIVAAYCVIRKMWPYGSTGLSFCYSIVRVM